MSSTTSSKSQKMTEGNITRLLVMFALPLFVGNLFQQFYNTVDSIVVGNFVSKTALAAVGSTDCIINTIIGFFTGLSTGAGVVIAHSFGAGNNVIDVGEIAAHLSMIEHADGLSLRN